MGDDAPMPRDDPAGSARRRGRPPRYAPGEREARILDAMERAVASEGLGGARVERVAREAGMSKRTVYAVFASRDALFAGWVQRLRASFVRPLTVAEQRLPLRVRLRRLLRREMEAATAEQRLAVLRVLVSEAPRHPALARAFLREGPVAARAIVADELARARAAGEIAVDDVDAAARLLFDMAYVNPLDLLLDPLLPPPSVAASEARLEMALDVFCRGVGSGAANDEDDARAGHRERHEEI